MLVVSASHAPVRLTSRTQTYAQAMVADVDDVDEWRVAARMGWRHWLTVTVGGCASLAHGVVHSGCVTPGV